MAVKITRYNDRLICTFNARAVNHVSPYTGFRLNYLKIKILPFQSPTNPLRLFSLKIGVRGSAFSSVDYLVLNPLMRYIYIIYLPSDLINSYLLI